MNDKDRADRIAARCESLRIKIAEQDARIKRLEEALRDIAYGAEGTQTIARAALEDAA